MTSAATFPSWEALCASIGFADDVADGVDVRDVRPHLRVDGNEPALVDR